VVSIESRRAARPETASTLEDNSYCQFNHNFCWQNSIRSGIQLFHRIHTLSARWKFTQYASFFAARALRQLSIAPNLTVPTLIACRWGWRIVTLLGPRSSALVIIMLLTHSLTGPTILAGPRLNGGKTKIDPIVSRTDRCATW
jgi:hypothetical protein